MHDKYLDNPDYTFEKVNRASMACGPMVKWAIAQVRTKLFCSELPCFFSRIAVTT